MRSILAVLCLALGAPMASADTALILANGRYGDASDLRQTNEVLRLERPLAEAGFDVITLRDGTTEGMRGAVERLLQAEEDERVLVITAGHLARSRSGTWVLGVEASEPTLATVGAQGVELSVLMEIASRAPGRAVVLVGQEPRRVTLGDGLARGLGNLQAPQGVTVISGAPADLAAFTREVLLQPGANLAEAVGDRSGLRSHGFLSPHVAYFDPEPDPASDPDSDEIALWEAAVELDTAGAYRAYLTQYPQGRFAGEALARVQALEMDPRNQAEAAEEALGLSRDARRRIQRDLTLLGYDTRGIDGIFGNGTRSAIQRWQRDNRESDSGFLTRSQIEEMREQAAVRTAELEEQARIEREAQERADRAFWQATGQGADEAGLRSYLSRYPDGLFAEIAEARLAEIEAGRRAQAEAQERAEWDRARAVDTVEAYEQYLNAYPQGLFQAEAEARLEQLRNPGLPREDLAAAEAQEAALNLPQFTRLLTEQRLAAMGLEPGRVDGTFDDSTRRAIRRYQSARGLPATGYMTQDTVVRLLAEAIGGRVIE